MNPGLHNVIILGPVTPYRGGIAHHTTRLANALAALSEVRVMSFARLYPGWLYPGKFQKEESLLKLIPPVDLLLDSVNPLTWHSAFDQISAQRPDYVIIPWWTFFLAPCLLYIAIRLSKVGIPVMFYCHNVVDHETSLWKKLLAKTVLHQGSSFVVQTREEESRLRELLGDIMVKYHPHPVYDQFPPAQGSLKRRADLELLFYGFIRPYKGLDILLEAMSGLKDLDVRLSVVGEPWEEEAASWERRIHEQGIGDIVEFVPRYVSEEESAEYFNRADAIVLPYRSATGTGVVAAAYHYRKPVIASNVGGLRDVVIDGETGMLAEPASAAGLQAAIRRFAKDGIPSVAENIDQVIKGMTWEHLAGQLVDQTGWDRGALEPRDGQPAGGHAR
jgi:glycosyltransferase involved in cell wall biosynthesis